MHSNSFPILLSLSLFSGYACAADFSSLEESISRQIKDRHIPALSISLVDGDAIVWSKGFGYTNALNKTPATSKTVYRIGSVSKLFTDLAIMKLVERGEINLDAPVQTYLPDFHPRSRFSTAITLRHLMSHRSGLVREPPVGNYFDSSKRSLAETVESLNDTDLIYEPGSRTKYSNAGIAVAGYILEKRSRMPFPETLKHSVLAPLQLTDSAFEPESKLLPRLAESQMWAHHRDPFPAPTFQLGMIPAGSMYSTVDDLGRFLIALFQPNSLVREATLQEMYTPQFTPVGERKGFGLGFSIDQLDGFRRVGHGGAIYGFATELAALPEQRLGVVVIAARDGENDMTRSIADEALRLLLSTKKPAQPPARFAKLIGEYGWDYNVLYVYEKAGKLNTLIEWFFDYSLEEDSPGKFHYGNQGLYAGEALTFSAEGVKVGGVLFPRRAPPDAGTTFRIQPVRPIAELQKEAAQSKPPFEKGTFRDPDLVDIAAGDPSIHLDIRYASSNNFLQTPVYSVARAFMQRPAAEALKKANAELRLLGFGLLIHDAYRPWAVTKVFWDATPEPQHIFVADPSQGSRHNRGCAVDLTLYDLSSGEVIEMTGGYDEMTERSFPGYPGGTSLQRWHRDLLRRTMEKQGFRVFDVEWWHFDYQDWPKYPILNIPLAELSATGFGARHAGK